MAFITGKYLRYIPAHDIATPLGGEKARALPMFHAFTGCNTVSSFAGGGKKTAFDIWKSINEVTAVLSTLSTNSWSFNDDFMCILETYVVLLYTRTCTETTVDSARKHILCSKAGKSKPYHPQEQYCFNTRSGLYTKVDMYGDKHVSVLQNFLRQRPAGGERVPRKLGSRCGHCFQKQWHRVQNCYAAGGRKHEEDCASVSELL